jgi:hypothetical protein
MAVAAAGRGSALALIRVLRLTLRKKELIIR